MKQQNYKNHSRLVFGYHFVGGSLLLVLMVGSLVDLITSSQENLYSSLLIFIGSIVLLIIAFYARAFALKAQDRAIKAEENFRHYLLTGKPLSSDLRMRQIIGLRFASDDEFPALADKAVREKLSEKEIKQSIVNWKSDWYRV